MERLAKIGGHVLGQSGSALSSAHCSAEDKKLAGKNAVVTGAGSGIGRASCECLALNGARVLCVDIKMETAEETAAMINEQAGSVVAVAMAADVADEQQVKATVDKCVSLFGSIDVYFANAGWLPPYRNLEETTEDSMIRAFKINTLGAFYAIKHAVPLMQQAGSGSVICTASVAALRADVTAFEYSAAKGALISLVRSVADRLAGSGVRVNAIVPGGVATGMTTGVAQDLDERGLSVKGYDYRAFPPADPSWIANVLLFLASEDSAFINGQSIVCDGGMSNSMGMRAVKKRKDKANRFDQTMK